jgi:formylglycine-generating enzyme required for sulfatase activity
MAGNVSEWCADPYQPYPGSSMEPPAQDDQPTPVLRGGTWASHGCDLRSGNRSRLWQHYKLSTVGLRLKAAF